MRSSGDRRSLRDDVVGDRVLHGGLSRAGRCGCRKICKVGQGDAGGPGVVRDGVSQFHELVKWRAIGGRKYQDRVLQEAAEKGFSKQRVFQVLASIAQQLPHAMEQLGGPVALRLRFVLDHRSLQVVIWCYRMRGIKDVSQLICNAAWQGAFHPLTSDAMQTRAGLDLKKQGP